MFCCFQKQYPGIYQTFPSNVFNCDDHKDIRLITRLRAGTSYLREHKCKHSFRGCLSSICSCGLDIESTSHFLLHCPIFSDERYTLLSTWNKIDCKLLELTNSSLLQTLLHGNTLFDKEKNTSILNVTTEYILSPVRVEEPPIQ